MKMRLSGKVVTDMDLSRYSLVFRSTAVHPTALSLVVILAPQW